MKLNIIHESKKFGVKESITGSLCNKLNVTTIPPLSNVPVCENGVGCVYRTDIGGYNGEIVYICKNPNDSIYTKFEDLS